MLKKILTIIPVLSLVGALSFAAAPVLAAPCGSPSECINQGATGAGGGGTTSTDPAVIIKNIVNILLYIIGAVSVVMIVIGGFKYVVSNGDAAQVKSAKDTIFYAVIGIIVAVLAYAIVNFVISNIK